MNDETQKREYRGFQLERDRHFMFWAVVSTPDGSKIPRPLLSKFTNIQVAEAAIDLYIQDIAGVLSNHT